MSVIKGAVSAQAQTPLIGSSCQIKRFKALFSGTFVFSRSTQSGLRGLMRGSMRGCGPALAAAVNESN